MGKRKAAIWGIIGILTFFMAVLLSSTIFKTGFIISEKKNNITIVDTASKNWRSFGTDVRIVYVKINGEEIPFSEMKKDAEWVEMDDLLVAVNPKNAVQIEIPWGEVESLEIDFQKHNGSGIVEVYDNGQLQGRINLYDSDWSSAKFEGPIGTFSIFLHPVRFFSIWISLIVCFFSVMYYVTHMVRNGMAYLMSWGVFGCLVICFWALGHKQIGKDVLTDNWLLFYGITCWCGLNAVILAWDKKRRKIFSVIATCIGVFIVVVLAWMQLEIGCSYGNIFGFWFIEFRYILLNLLTIIAFIMMIDCIVIKWWISCAISSTVLFIIGIINYYVIQFHSMPLSVNEIRNFGTAMGVVGSYKFQIDIYIMYMILFYLMSLCFILLIRRAEKKVTYSWTKIAVKDGILCVLSFCIMYQGYWSDNAVKSVKKIEYAWQETFHKYGYVACTVDLIGQAYEVIQEPDGYSDERVSMVAEELNTMWKTKTREGRTPDVILILNETFFDLRQVADIKTDHEFLSNWDAMTNVVRGYAVAPLIGGGTNCSEYELLTGNSLEIMQGITPFYVLDLTDANGIASNLNALGYETLAAHSEWENSYNRAKSYPELGFKTTRFDNEFKGKVYYGNREYYETDESLYKNLVNWYEQMEEDKPRFIYLLTIQNHGDWNMNDSDDAIVHLTEDWGENTEQLNEYLSCIKQSDEALKALLEYFSAVDRDVVVCMVGDHSPYLVYDIVNPNFSEQEKNLRLRGTPFVIWSNRAMKDKNLGYISLNYLAATIFEEAGIQASPYYEYMQQMRESVPILSDYGKYYDMAGREYDYEDQTEYTEEVENYFFLEFNNLKKAGRREELFVP